MYYDTRRRTKRAKRGGMSKRVLTAKPRNRFDAQITFGGYKNPQPRVKKVR